MGAAAAADADHERVSPSNDCLTSHLLCNENFVFFYF